MSEPIPISLDALRDAAATGRGEDLGERLAAAGINVGEYGIVVLEAVEAAFGAEDRRDVSLLAREEGFTAGLIVGAVIAGNAVRSVYQGGPDA